MITIDNSDLIDINYWCERGFNIFSVYNYPKINQVSVHQEDAIPTNTNFLTGFWKVKSLKKNKN